MPYIESVTSRDLPGKTGKTEDYMRFFEETCDEKGVPASAKYISGPVLENIIIKIAKN